MTWSTSSGATPSRERRLGGVDREVGRGDVLNLSVVLRHRRPCAADEVGHVVHCPSLLLEVAAGPHPRARVCGPHPHDLSSGMLCSAALCDDQPEPLGIAF